MQPEQNNQPTGENPLPQQVPTPPEQVFTPPQLDTAPIIPAPSETPPLQPLAPNNITTPPQPLSPAVTGVVSKPASSHKRPIILIVASVLLLGGIIAAVILLTKGDSNKKDNSSKTSNNSSSSNSANTTSNNSTNSGDEQSSRDVTESKISQTITDDPLKYNITVNKMVVNVPFNSSTSSYISDENVGVLVEVTATNNSDYYTSIGSYDFKMVTTSGSSEYESSYNLTDYAKEKGYTLLSSKYVSRGDTVTAWLAFEVPKNEAAKLKLRYERDQRKGSDGTTLAAVKIEVPLN